MRNVVLALIISVAVLAPLPSRAAVTVEFFWGTGCPHCAQVEPYIDRWEKQYPTVEFKRLEVYKNRNQAELLVKRFEQYAVPEDHQGVPAVFLGDQYFVGDQPIIDGVPAALDQALRAASVDPPTSSDPVADTKEKSKLSPWTVLSAAFVDSINPCAIAVLLILFSGLLMSRDSRRMWRAALAFIVSIFLAYFLFGLGIVYTIHITGVAAWMTRVVGGLAIVIGLANLKDAIWYGGGGFVMEIPRRWRPRMITLIDRVTSPLGAFLTGFAVTLFELPCTGGPYFVVLGLLADHVQWGTILPVLLFYNLVFVAPLLLLAVLITRGYASTEQVTAWKDRNLRRLHLIAGLVLVALGVWVMF